jgi:hypothetical protein
MTMLSTLSRFRTSWHGVLALFVGIILVLYVMEPLTMSGARRRTISTELQRRGPDLPVSALYVSALPIE